MGIEILSSEVIDQIAAGEVVERPAHLVKELLENAFDASATEIEVAVWQGGRKIRVTDNGRGIEPSDLKKACLRHATSKVRSTEDLWKLSSFGFRGEALSSISSVSRLSLRSRQADQNAFSISVHFGKIFAPEETSGPFGTEVLVEDLFENIPARLKFLKTRGAETAQIRQTVKALALVHPQAAIRFLIDGQLESYWPSRPNLLARAEQVLDQQNLFETSLSKEGFQIELVLSPPNQTFRSAKSLWFFVQDRWVQDRAIHAAVIEGYRSLLMHGEYPLAVLKISGPPEQIDVNVHPSKSQVKFQAPSFIFQLVQRTVREALEKTPWVESMKPQLPKERGHQFESEQKQFAFSQPQFQSTQFRHKSGATSYASLRMADLSGSASQRRQIADDFENSQLRSSSSAIELLTESPASSEKSSQFWGQLHVLGQANLTYILAQNERDFFLVDQHAAHERVLFEKIWQMWQNGAYDIQRYLLPLMLELKPEQAEALDPYLHEFQKFGLEVERAGPQTLAITSAPIWLRESSIAPALLQTSDDILDSGGSFALENKVRDLAATMACHSAVRAGQSLSSAEMKALLEQMDEFSFSTFCPHGRPVYLKWGFGEIERDFGRLG